MEEFVTEIYELPCGLVIHTELLKQELDKLHLGQLPKENNEKLQAQ